jgi:hypothetical protein
MGCTITLNTALNVHACQNDRQHMSPKLSSAPDALRIGRVIPALTAAVAALILFSGLLPLRWFRFQDYEMARQVLQWDAPFIPNLRLRTSFYEGDEAQAGNLRPTESLGWRTFSTDRLGFRFTPPMRPGEPPAVVVFRGFSFVFGVALGDEQTFPAALSRQLGVNAYNAARFHEDPETPQDFDRLMSRIGAHPKTVVYVHLEPNAHVLTPAAVRPDMRRRLLRFAKEFPMTWIRLSPAILGAIEEKKALENDLILHNRYRDHVRAFDLPAGGRMLVRKGDLERVETRLDDSVVADRSAYIAWWGERLAERGARMVVLLVPEKMTLYGPALGVTLPADRYLDRMESNLTARGVSVVNGLTVLRATADEDLATGRLAFLREDHHWNAEGVERLARATAQAIGAVPPTESSRIR